MTEVEQPSQNGIDTAGEDDANKARPADIEADMREMERRKRVEAIMCSKLFREELERIVDSQIREGGPSGILQHLSDLVGVPAARVGSVFKTSNCVLPINDIRGVESMGYAKGERILRCKLAATFRLLDLYGWTQGLGAQITARLNADQELFLVNPFGLLFHEVTASSLNKVDMQGNIVEHGTTNFGININHYILHSVVHAARPDIRCAIYIGCNPVVAVSSLKVGLLPLTSDAAVLGEIATHPYTGSLNEPEEREKLIRSLGPISKVLLLNNHGALCCGETIEEAFYAAYHIVQACETQLKVLPVGLDNLNLIPEEARKALYDASRKPPDGYEHKTSTDNQQQDNRERPLHSKPKWRVGGVEFEALMRMLDNAGFRTGYTYRNALVKSELPKPKNDVEVPPAVSSLGYLLEEEELYRQGIWKKSDLRKGGDRTRWLNSPNVYQRVEVLETGTPDPKKITKWVADGSPTHSTAVKIDNAMQFVPPGTNPKEFKRLQQQIKDNRRADKISAGPQSHILEGVTWDEANRIKDATVSATGDHVVLMGAASKGIIQRGYQHNATVYKAPYAKNPFDSVTDDDLNEYKKTVERKHAHGEYTDTDFSESEALSSLQTSGAQQKSPVKHAPSQSETEDASEPQVLRIETKQAPKPSQPEVVLSDATNDFLNVERMHTTTSKKPPTGRAVSHNIQENLVSDEFKNPSEIYYANFDPSLLRTKLNAFKNDFFNDPLNNLNCEYSNSSDSLKILNSYPTLDWSNLDFKTLEELHLDFRFHRDNSDSNKFLNPYICKFSGINREDKQDRNSFMVFDENHSFRSNEWISFNNSNTTYVCGTQSRGEHTPYRTSSQFTFNYPRYIQPDHKHIPLCPSKFVPCKQYHSYHEIFSSHRFLNSPDDDFSNILKRKAKDSVIRFLSKVENPSKRLKLANVLETDAMDIDETEGLIVNPDWLNQRSIGSNLDTIIEEDERSMGGADKNERNYTPGFYEKIKNINYSNVSPNLEFNNTKTVSSDISLIPVVEQSTAEKDAIVDEINSFMNNLTLEEKEDEIHIDNVENSGEISGRSLMSRKQREMRKEEFYDLWNDHIAYYSCRDSMDSTVHDIENSNSSNDDNYETRSEITISSPSPFELDHSSGVSVDYFNGHFGYNIGQSASNSSRQGLSNNMFLASELSDSGETKDDFLSYESFKSDLISLSSNKNFSNMEINSDIEIIPSENLDHTKNLSEIDDNDELNSMEKLILEKITTSKDINREEKIIQKIETTIRNKVTPSKLEKKINEEISGMSPQQLNSTLNTIKSNSSSKSSNSKNILNTTASTNDSVVMKTSRQSISFSNSSSEKDKKKKACGCEPKRKLPLCPSLLRTKKINKVQKPSNTSATRPAIKNQKNKDNIAVDVKITKPENKKSNLKKKRNFISENILNVSSKQRRLNQNVGAIFSLNPFTTAPNGSSTKVQVEFRKKLTSNVDNAVYSFETGKSTSGSPSFWVTMSPGSNVKKTKTFTLKKKQSSGTTKSSRTQKPPTFNMSNGKRKRNSRDKVARSNKESGSPMEGIKCIDDEIRELGQATNRLDKHTESCERKIDEFGKQITKMSRDFDDIVEFHQNIENSRLENEREMLASAVALNYSLSAEED